MPVLKITKAKGMQDEEIVRIEKKLAEKISELHSTGTMLYETTELARDLLTESVNSVPLTFAERTKNRMYDLSFGPRRRRPILGIFHQNSLFSLLSCNVFSRMVDYISEAD